MVIVLALSLSSMKCKKEDDLCPTCPPPATDTTSHNFNWTITQLGDGASSVLYDVAILNDTLAYAVGEINVKDTMGNWQNPPYNVAKWNGREWKLYSVLFNYQGQQVYSDIRSVYAFDINNIWFEAGIHWNGVQFETVAFNIDFPSHVNKIWGSSSNDLYIVGNNGLIAHRGTNGTWTKIESGTMLDVYDIYGASGNVFAVAAQQFVSNEKKILRIVGNNVSSVPTDSIPYSIHGIWFKPNVEYFVVGSGIYAKNEIQTPGVWQWLHPSITNYYIYSIDGNDVNDIMVCGSYGELLHFNGNSWKSFRSEIEINAGAYKSVKVKGNLCIAVGYDSPLAVIAIGKR